MNDEKMKEGTIAPVTPGAIAPASVDAVAGGYCPDPFAILGPHAIYARDAWTLSAPSCRKRNRRTFCWPMENWFPWNAATKASLWQPIYRTVRPPIGSMSRTGMA